MLLTKLVHKKTTYTLKTTNINKCDKLKVDITL